MIKYCHCNHCLQNEIIANPYNIYERELSLSEIRFEFDIRTASLCRFDCKRFRKKPSCPPNIPDMEYYKKVFMAYTNIYIIGGKYPYADGLFQSHWRNYSTNEIHDLLLKKEIELFKKGHIYAKAFIGGSCKACPSQVCDPVRCRFPNKGRVPIEATGLHVFLLMTSLGLEYQEPPIDFFWRIGVVFF